MGVWRSGQGIIWKNCLCQCSMSRKPRVISIALYLFYNLATLSFLWSVIVLGFRDHLSSCFCAIVFNVSLCLLCFPGHVSFLSLAICFHLVDGFTYAFFSCSKFCRCVSYLWGLKKTKRVIHFGSVKIACKI